jgi:hypothetical protein
LGKRFWWKSWRAKKEPLDWAFKGQLREMLGGWCKWIEDLHEVGG